jgi:hypothetical protein
MQQAGDGHHGHRANDRADAETRRFPGGDDDVASGG